MTKIKCDELKILSDLSGVKFVIIYKRMKQLAALIGRRRLDDSASPWNRQRRITPGRHIHVLGNYTGNTHVFSVVVVYYLRIYTVYFP